MISYSVTQLDEVDSTNTCVKRMMREGAPEGCVVIARRQTGGYGRRGHAWASPEGSLYMSVLLRPGCQPDALPTLGLLVGVSVCRALRGLLPEDSAGRVLLKWPNDVVVEDASAPEGFAKICGISLEGDASGVCIGIGVNVIRPSDPQESERKQAYLEELASGGALSVKQVADEVLSELAHTYDEWRCSGFASFAKEYEELNIMRSASVDVEIGESVISGEFAGVDEAGRMLLRTDSGTRAISSGDAHVRGLT